MAKLVNNQWRTRAAVALVIAATLAGCGRRDDNDDGDGGNGNGGGGNANNPTDTFAITSMNRLVRFSRTSPAVGNAVNITGLAPNETVLGFDFRPADGTLVVLGSSGRLYRLNITDGTTTLLSTLSADNTDTTQPFTALDGTSFGVNFNPVPDRLRVVSNTGQNLRINVTNGAVTTDGPLSSADVTATSYNNSFSSACRTRLFYINTMTNQLLTTDDPNLGMLVGVGNLDVDTGVTINGFEVLTTTDSTNTITNTALVVLTTPATAASPATSTLNTVNLATAELSNPQTITGLAAGETIAAISMAPPNGTPNQALGDLVAVTESNRLISFNAGSPQKLCTAPVRITNLQSGDNVLGIDVRPSDGLLYAVGSGGRLYTINTTIGTNFANATPGPLLQSAASSSFNGLNGDDFGFDFNPTNNNLRLVSNRGQNLSIDVELGAVTTQTALNPGNPSVTAAAYTNSVRGAGSTTLFVINTGNETLSIQGMPVTMPANGILVPQGNLNSGDVTGVSGFDINGQTGVAVAALTLASTPGVTDLFTINLSSGLATRVNTIGVNERIRGLAFASAVTPMVTAVTADNQLITFDPATPDALVDTVRIEGLQGGESVIALQVQSNTKLRITTDGQRTYTLDAITGEATLVAGTEMAVQSRPAALTTAAGVRLSATASSGGGLSFGVSATPLGQSRLFKLDAGGQATAVGMIGPSGTATIRALAIRMN
jgi:trimeric autotransporter adhesin